MLGMNHLAIAPDLGHGLHQPLDCDIANAGCAIALLIRNTRADIVMKPMARPAWYAIVVRVQRYGIDPVLCNILDATVRKQHDL